MDLPNDLRLGVIDPETVVVGVVVAMSRIVIKLLTKWPADHKGDIAGISFCMENKEEQQLQIGFITVTNWTLSQYRYK